MKRVTSQRCAIEKVFSEAAGPLNVEQVLQKGRKAVSSLNQATVYRNLKAMVQEGALSQVTHPTLGALYEKADKHHHHHFHCRQCDKVYEIAGCPLNEPVSAPQGFVTEAHQVFLSGTCADCAGV